jgi:ankyrin repeat protein
MRQPAVMVGTLLGLAAGIAVTVLIGQTARSDMMAIHHKVAIGLCGLGVTGVLAAFGNMIGGFLVRTFQQKSPPARQPTRDADHGDVIVAELVAPDEPVTASSNQIAMRAGMWGWILGSLGIVAAAAGSLLGLPAASMLSLLSAFVLFCVGAACSLAGVARANSSKVREPAGYAIAGMLANVACMLCIVVFGSVAVLENHRQAQLARRSPPGTVRQVPRVGRRSSPARRPQPVSRPRVQRPAPPPRRATLQEAVAANQVEEVRKYIDAGAELNTVYRDGQTLLIRAVTRGHIDVARLLLDHGADVNGNPDARLNPLILAIDQRHVPMANLLLDYEPDLSLTDSGGYTPLLRALMTGSNELVERLLTQGADPNRFVGSHCSLDIAVQAGDVEIVRELVSHGAKVTVSSLRLAKSDCLQAIFEESSPEEKRRQVARAIVDKNTELMRRLIDAGFDTNTPIAGTHTALAMASRVGDAPTVRLLLDHLAGSPSADLLRAAVDSGSTETLGLLLDRCADLNTDEASSGSLLLATVERGGPQAVKLLLDHGINLTAGDTSERKLLLVAIKSGEPETVRLLLDHGIDPKSDANFGQAALLAAIAEYNPSMIRMLVSRGATAPCLGDRDTVSQLLCKTFPRGPHDFRQALVDVSGDAFPPKGRQQLLYLAIDADAASLVRSLIDAGADLDDPPAGRHPALAEAVRRQSEAVIEVLLDGAEELPEEVFSAAIEGRAIDTVKGLLERGATVKASHIALAAADPRTEIFDLLWQKGKTDLSGEGAELIVNSALRKRNVKTGMLVLQQAPEMGSLDGPALHMAVNIGNVELVRLLIDKGADANGLTDRKKPIIITAAQTKNVDVLQVLLDGGADPTVTENGSTTLHAAAYHSTHEMVALLAGHFEDVNVRAALGETPLHKAAQTLTRDDDVIRCLLELGADPTIKDRRGKTALHLAAAAHFDAVIKMLVDAGADVNARDNNGETPLHVAAKARGRSSLEILLRHGADPDIKSAEGVTPREWAKAKGKDMTVFDKTTRQ